MAGRWAREYLDSGVSRRTFLKAIGAAAVVASSVVPGCIGESSVVPSVTPAASPSVPAASEGIIVAIDADPVKLVDKAIDAYGGLSDIIKKGDRVLVKANFAFAKEEKYGTCNHPQVLARIMERCRDAGAGEVVVADHTLDNPAKSLQVSGIKAALDRAGFRAEPFNNGPYVDKAIPGSTLGSAGIAKSLLDADVFINAPIIKSHSSATMTASMKNLIGAVSDMGAFHTKGLDRCIADIAGYLRPTMIIADAYRVPRYGGPNNGKVDNMIYPHTVIIGHDPVAIDSYGASLMNIKPRDVGHIMEAYEAGLGEYDLDKVNVTRV